MLYFPNTSIELSRERPVAVGHVVHAEGLALVATQEGGRFGVKPSTGAAGEKLFGFSINSVSTAVQAPAITRAKIVDGKVSTENTPLAGTFLVKIDGVVAGSAAVPTADKYVQNVNNTREFGFHADDEGKAVEIVYSYAPTLVQAIAMQGNILPGGPVGQYLGQVGVIERGDVYTDQWDTAGDWGTAVGVKLGASGKLTPAATAAEAIGGVTIVESPLSGRGILGVHVNAPV